MKKSDKRRRMPIMEIFGPTIQGEGMVIGQKTMFIRTGGCDYSCSWCDSAFTWNGEEKARMMTPEEVMAEVRELGTRLIRGEDDNWIPVLNFEHITISGGNPALIGVPMAEFIDLCHESGIKLGLETQGSKWQDWMWEIDDLTISPKPPSSGMITDFEVLDDIIMKLRDRTNFSLKVVVFDERDYQYARQIHTTYPDVPFYLSAGNVDPKEEGDISGRLLSQLGQLWDMVLNDPIMNDARPLPQLHTLVWANKRGV